MLYIILGCLGTFLFLTFLAWLGFVYYIEHTRWCSYCLASNWHNRITCRRCGQMMRRRTSTE